LTRRSATKTSFRKSVVEVVAASALLYLIASSIASSRRSGSTGFVRKPQAPALVAGGVGWIGGHENDGRPPAARAHLGLQLQSCHPGHVQIGHDAGEPFMSAARQHLFGTRIAARRHAGRTEQTVEAATDIGIVVDNGYDGGRRHKSNSNDIAARGHGGLSECARPRRFSIILRC
jgi:hypothetical protein